MLLLFLFPIPAIVYARVTLAAADFRFGRGGDILNWIGIPVLRDGNILELPHERLSVVEACSGIRSLLSLSFLSLVYAYFFDRRVGDAMGAAGGDGSDRDCGQCGARHVDGRAQ